MRTAATVRATVLDGFDDPRLDEATWAALLQRGDTREVFLTRAWQRAWWQALGRGDLLLVLAERDGRPAALAPLFADGGMVFLVGSGGSDYLDLVGDTGDPQVLDALLSEAAIRTPGFVGFRFYHLPEWSRTGARLAEAAERLGLACFDEGDLPAPSLEIATRPEAALAATRKASLLRHERGLRRDGDLVVRHLREAGEVLPHLETLFDQHRARWASVGERSLFEEPAQRRLYELVTEAGAAAGWLRFTVVEWEGRPIAYHFGSCFEGSYLWYKPSFEIELARRSPGEVLLRHLLLAAIDEGARRFDLGLGDEPFKRRFATEVRTVRTWGLYPSEGSP